MSPDHRPDRLVVCSSHALPTRAQADQWPLPPPERIWAAWDTARATIDEFDPALVVMFSGDHRRTFRDVIPTVAVALSATGRGDRDGPTGPYRVPADLAREIAGDLVAHEIDAAIAYRPSLDHAFGHSARDLLGGLDTRPVVPVFINSSSPPVPTLRRAATIGRRIGAFLAGRPERILYMGSGGLTHDLPGFYPPDDGVDHAEDVRLERIARLTAELRVPGRSFTSAWDHEFLTGLAGTDDSWLAEVGRDITTRAGNGGHEALGWVAAWAAAGQPLTTLTYEFNPRWSAGQAVAGSAWAFAPAGRTAAPAQTAPA